MSSDLPRSSIVTSDNTSSKVTEDSTTEEATSQGSYGTTKQSEGTSTTDLGTTRSKSTTVFVPEPTQSTTEGDHIPEIRTLPPPPPPKIDYPFNIPSTPRTTKSATVSSETSELIALIIGIVAGVLIAVILVVLVILKFSSGQERVCKIDDGKGYQQGPNAALLGNTNSNGQTQYQINGALRNGDKGQMQKAKKRDSKDIKEWYV